MANGESLFQRVGAGAAALFSPQAAQSISATRAQRRGAESDRQKLMQTLIVTGVAEGNIPTEEGANALEKLGLPDAATSIRDLRIQRPEQPAAPAQVETVLREGVPTRVGFDPVTLEERGVLGEAPAKQPLIQQQIGAKAEEAGAIERAKQREKAQAATLKGFRDDLKSKQDLSEQTRQLTELTKQFPTGPTAPLRLAGAKIPIIGELFGVDVVAGENIEKIQTKLNLKGTELIAGAISEKELDLVGRAFASMTATPEGNFIISKLAESATQNARRRLSEAQKWIQENGALEFTNDQGQVFEDWWSDELNQTETIIGFHPEFGEVTLDDILTTAREGKMTIEQVVNRYGLF